MRTICAWCEHEGKMERGAEHNGRVRYAICETHTARLVSQLHKYYPPGKSARPDKPGRTGKPAKAA